MHPERLDRRPGKGADRDHDHDRHQRRHRDDRDQIAQAHHQDQQEHPRHETRQPPAPAGFHVDDRLADHGAARHAADEPGGGVGQALAHAFLVPVRLRVGQVIDDVLRHQAFQKADDGDRDGIGQDDLQRLQVERNVRKQEHRQRVGQLAHVAHGAHVPAEGRGQRGQHDDRDQAARGSPGQSGKR
jgi:hypothetical protein